MAESSSHNPSSPKITLKEEPVTLDKPESPNPFLPADQIEFTFERFPSPPTMKSPTQHKEYLCEFWYTAKTLDDSKIWVSTPTSGIRGNIGYSGEIGAKGTLKKSFLPPSFFHLHSESASGHDALANSTAEADPGLFAPNNSIPTQQLDDLSYLLKDTRSAFFTLDSPQDEPIIVSDESEEDETEKDKDTHATSHNIPEDTLAKAEEEVASLKARPSYPYINQLTELLVTSLKPELSKLLTSHDFASCLPTELKELPSKFTTLSGDIKELKQHVCDMKIELPEDLKEIPTKLETFTSAISSLTSQVAELKNIQWELPTEFATMVENASGATTKDVPSVGQATALPAEGEKNTNPTTTDAEPNLHDELVDLLGIDVVTQYYNKKLLYDK
ncbi:hypothetical protein Tco_1166806 [Tanacetum coccineum]